MGVGQVISDTFGMVKDRFGPLLGLWATYFALTIVVFIAMAIGIGASGVAGLAAFGEGNALAAGGAMVVLVVVFYIGYLLVAMAQYASLISMASPTGRPTFGDAFSAGWRAAPALLLLMIVLIIAYLAAALLFGAIGSALGDTGSLVLTLLLIPVVVWVGSRLAPLFAVVAVDRVRNPFAAISRSWQMTRGHALTIFLAWLVFIVILIVVCGIALLPSIGLLRSMADPTSLESAAPAFGGVLLLMLGFLVVSVLFTIIYSAFQAVIHGTLTGAGGEQAAEAFA